MAKSENEFACGISGAASAVGQAGTPTTVSRASTWLMTTAPAPRVASQPTRIGIDEPDRLVPAGSDQDVEHRAAVTADTDDDTLHGRIIFTCRDRPSCAYRTPVPGAEPDFGSLRTSRRRFWGNRPVGR